MICQATYNSLEDIPEELRDEFHQVNGKWQLKDDAIPGVGPLFNPALAANEQKAVGQVKSRNIKIKDLEEENHRLQDRISALDQPGHVVLSKEDSEAWSKYVKLGTPSDVETKLKDHATSSTKLHQLETKENLAKVVKAVKDVNLNVDVLTDWATRSDSSHLEFFVKSVEQTDTKGVKTTVEVPYVKIKTQKGDAVEVSEREMLPFAKESLPEWQYTALVAGAAPGKIEPQQKPGVKVPDLGSTAKVPAPVGDKKRPVDKFNEQREARPSPFAKPLVAAPAIGQVRN